MSDKKTSHAAWPVYVRLLGYVRRYWLIFVIAVIANFVYSGIDAFFVYFLKPVLDKGFIGRDATFLAWLPFLIVLVFLLRGLVSLTSSYCMAYVSRNVIMIMRQALFEHFQKLPASFYDSVTSGTLLSTIIYNVGQVANASTNAITMFIQSIALVIGLLIVMLSISWQITLFYFAIIPIIALIVRLSSYRTRKITHKLQVSMADIVNVAEENIEGYREVRAFGGSDFEIERFNHLAKRNRQWEMKNVLTKAFSVTGVQLIAACALGVTVYVASSPIAGHILTAGGFIALIGAMLAILKPLKNLTTVNTVIQRGVAGAQSVFSMLDEVVEEDTGTRSLTRAQGKIDFEHVTFRYPKSDKLVLRDINLTVHPGETVALVGHSGGGKSTLVGLLPRFYQNYDGVIRIDDIDTREYKLADLRQQFALVSQHVILFNDTVRNNICYGQTDTIAQDSVIEAAKSAFADEFIRELPEGYNTLIGENGVLLSGGQRQRIAIARAILKNAPILILDEATSALDTVSERHIQKALDRLMQNRTTFVIAHRLSTIERADKILVLEQGQIVETGNHETLIKQGGVYAQLHAMQFQEDKLT